MGYVPPVRLEADPAWLDTEFGGGWHWPRWLCWPWVRRRRALMARHARNEACARRIGLLPPDPKPKPRAEMTERGKREWERFITYDPARAAAAGRTTVDYTDDRKTDEIVVKNGCGQVVATYGACSSCGQPVGTLHQAGCPHDNLGLVRFASP